MFLREPLIRRLFASEWGLRLNSARSSPVPLGPWHLGRAQRSEQFISVHVPNSASSELPNPASCPKLNQGREISWNPEKSLTMMRCGSMVPPKQPTAPKVFAGHCLIFSGFAASGRQRRVRAEPRPSGPAHGCERAPRSEWERCGNVWWLRDEGGGRGGGEEVQQEKAHQS